MGAEEGGSELRPRHPAGQTGRGNRRTSWRFLGAALVGAWFTKQALRPVRLPLWRAVPSFFAGWLTNELAFHHLAWQGIATALFIRAGALASWPGWVGLGVVAAQWAGLGVVIQRTFATREAVEQALEGSFVGDRTDIDVEPATSPGIRWSQLALPFPIRHPDVVRTRGICFSRDSGTDLCLDVFRRKDLPRGRPVILYVHGGAWIISNRNEQGLPLMHEMAARGWVGVNADYRLSPWATYPEHVIDVKRAIGWVRDHAEEIGADPRFIAIAGGSAGAHLATVAALTANEPRFQPGFEDAETSVQACVPFYGIYDFLDRGGHHGHAEFARFLERHVMKCTPADEPDRYRDASPIDLVHESSPPFLVIHGESDSLAPTAGARAFVAALGRISTQPVVYAELPGAQHAFDVFPSLRTSYVVAGIAQFLQRVYPQATSATAV